MTGCHINIFVEKVFFCCFNQYLSCVVWFQIAATQPSRRHHWPSLGKPHFYCQVQSFSTNWHHYSTKMVSTAGHMIWLPSKLIPRGLPFSSPSNSMCCCCSIVARTGFQAASTVSASFLNGFNVKEPVKGIMTASLQSTQDLPKLLLIGEGLMQLMDSPGVTEKQQFYAIFFDPVVLSALETKS